MRILFVAPFIPWPLNSGARQRVYALLRAIARRHRVTLTAPAAAEHQEAVAGLAGLIERFLPAPVEAYAKDGLHGSTRWKRVARYARDLSASGVPYSCRIRAGWWRALIAARRHEFDAAVCRNRYVSALDGFPPSRIVVDADDLNYMYLWRQARTTVRGWERYLVLAEKRRHANVFYLGAKPYDALPQYLACCDVAVIPFVLNEVTHACSPLKLFEYMAAGKPIVATPMREITKYRSVLFASGCGEFVQQLERAVCLGGDPEYKSLLRQEAESNTWRARAIRIREAVEVARQAQEGRPRRFRDEYCLPGAAEC
jgi:hypothetical protein